MLRHILIPYHGLPAARGPISGYPLPTSASPAYISQILMCPFTWNPCLPRLTSTPVTLPPVSPRRCLIGLWSVHHMNIRPVFQFRLRSRPPALPLLSRAGHSTISVLQPIFSMPPHQLGGVQRSARPDIPLHRVSGYLPPHRPTPQPFIASLVRLLGFPGRQRYVSQKLIRLYLFSRSWCSLASGPSTLPHPQPPQTARTCLRSCTCMHLVVESTCTHSAVQCVVYLPLPVTNHLK